MSQTSVENMTTKQRLARLGYEVRRVDERGIEIVRDGKRVHDTRYTNVWWANELIEREEAALAANT